MQHHHAQTVTAPGLQPLRILSYGCSTGEELRSLRAYFPDAILFGCDTNAEALRLAGIRNRGDDCILFESTLNSVYENGPYDIIFAMSVLCRAPDSKHVDDLNSLFPFSKYQDHTSLLTRSLIRKGLLCIHNSNYLFSQSESYSAFRPIRSALLHLNGFVDKFHCNGRRISRADDLRPHYHHEVVFHPDNLSTEDFLDCVFELSDDQAPHEVVFHYAHPPIEAECENLNIRWGKPPELLTSRGWIGSFQEVGYTVEGGKLWRYRRWCYSTIDRKIRKQRPLWDLMPYGDPKEVEVLTQQGRYSDPAPGPKKRKLSSLIKRATKATGGKL